MTSWTILVVLKIALGSTITTRRRLPSMVCGISFASTMCLAPPPCAWVLRSGAKASVVHILRAPGKPTSRLFHNLQRSCQMRLRWCQTPPRSCQINARSCHNSTKCGLTPMNKMKWHDVTTSSRHLTGCGKSLVDCTKQEGRDSDAKETNAVQI